MGTYTLRETKAPDGYVSLTDYTVTVTSGGVTVKDENGEAVDISPGKDSTYSFSVTNTPGQALPNTGGTGTLPYAVAGAAFMATAVLLHLRRRRV